MRLVDKRLAVSELPGGLRLVNDAYNANPASMAAGLRTVAAFGSRCRHVAILGDMLELGPAAEDLHRHIGALVAELGYSYLAVTGVHAIFGGPGRRGGWHGTDQCPDFPRTTGHCRLGLSDAGRGAFKERLGAGQGVTGDAHGNVHR
jgi:hypothetical protein